MAGKNLEILKSLFVKRRQIFKATILLIPGSSNGRTRGLDPLDVGSIPTSGT